LRGNPAAEHFAESAPGAPVDPRIEQTEGDLHVRHHRPSALFRSDLGSVLRALGADALLLTGVSVNNAISSTARDAFARDLPVLVVRDCVGATPWEQDEKHETYFEILATWTAEVADATDVLARLDARRR
jgi:nicotinamidase-related amidase